MRYLTKEWYLLCQKWPQDEAAKQQIFAALAARDAAQKQEDLPEGLRQQFSFHDGVISDVRWDGERGSDCVIKLNNPWSPYQWVIFRGMVKMTQDAPMAGMTWLYEELYRHKSGSGYEAHMLLLGDMRMERSKIRMELNEVKIVCEDIVFA